MRPAAAPSLAAVLVVVGCVTTLAACAPEGGACENGEPPSVIDHDEWRRVPLAEDPFQPGENDEIYPCEERDIAVEELGGETTWSVVTGSCNWATVAQPLERELKAGDVLRVEVFWFSQRDFPGAVATVGLAIGDEIVLAHPVAVPTEGSLLDVTVPVPSAVPAGTLLCFHVGNHGTNSWNLLDVTLVSDDGAAPEGDPLCSLADDG